MCENNLPVLSRDQWIIRDQHHGTNIPVTITQTHRLTQTPG